MSGWSKLFSSIVTSSIWCEPHTTLRVWVAMLAKADAEGIVEGSVPGFANLARVTVDEMRAAVTSLTSPDPESRTADFEGRRIEAIEGGWRILNYKSYRERGQAKDGSKAPAMRKYRARKRLEESNALLSEVTRYPEERRERQEVRGEKEDTHSARAEFPGSSGKAQKAKGHAAHAYCPDYHQAVSYGATACVPEFLHDEFQRALGKSVPDAAERLREFYGEVLAANDREPIENHLKFWRAAFASNVHYLTHSDFWTRRGAA